MENYLLKDLRYIERTLDRLVLSESYVTDDIAKLRDAVAQLVGVVRQLIPEEL